MFEHGGRTWACPSLGWSSELNRINIVKKRRKMLRPGLSLDCLSLLLGEYSTMIHPPDTLIRRNASQPFGSLLFSVSTLCVLCGFCSFGSFHCVRWPDWRWGEGRALQQPDLSKFVGCPENTSRERTLTTERCPQGWSLLVWSQFPFIQVKVMALCKILPLALHLEWVENSPRARDKGPAPQDVPLTLLSPRFLPAEWQECCLPPSFRAPPLVSSVSS